MDGLLRATIVLANRRYAAQFSGPAQMVGPAEFQRPPHLARNGRLQNGRLALQRNQQSDRDRAQTTRQQRFSSLQCHQPDSKKRTDAIPGIATARTRARIAVAWRVATVPTDAFSE